MVREFRTCVGVPLAVEEGDVISARVFARLAGSSAIPVAIAVSCSFVQPIN